MTTLFQNDNTDISQVTIPDNAYDSLVGEGKKYKDNEALAKAAFHKDAFIETLKGESHSKDAEIQRLQEELKARASMQDLIDAVRERELRDDNPDDSSGAPKPPTQEDIEKLLDQKLTERSKRAQAAQNVATVEAELQRVWGTSTKQKLQEKARELSLSPEFLQSVAETSPRAFLELIRPQAPAREDNLLVQSTVQTKEPPAGVRNQAWYEKEMKRDKKLRLDPDFQRQMHRDAMRMGQSFFDK